MIKWRLNFVSNLADILTAVLRTHLSESMAEVLPPHPPTDHIPLYFTDSIELQLRIDTHTWERRSLY